ncbi:MAG: Na-Ca exchanger/integrin-beta4 [Thermoleophilia bacterium]|jgi:hypothetical protein|nr:Na-Ca exchanger/integrin-beta4 [Thermoleophilia bacterium]
MPCATRSIHESVSPMTGLPRSLAPLVLLVLLAIPATAHAERAIAITGGEAAYRLATFDTTTPGTVTTVPLTGIGAAGSFQPVGLDVRPATGGIYVVGIRDDAGPTSTGQLFTVDPITGAASTVGASFSSTLPDATRWGVDVNPVVDRIRVVNDADDNFRLHPETGALTPDTALTPGSSDVWAAAYDRNTAGAASTTLYAIDQGADELVRVGGVDGTPSPNGGAVTSVGALGVAPVGATSFDISGASDTAYLATDGKLHTVNLATGAATLVGALEGSAALHGFAVLATSTIQVAPVAVGTSEAADYATVTVTRIGSLTLPATVNYGSVDGSAKGGTDFAATIGQLTFPADVATRTILVPILGDAAREATESFTLTIAAPGGAAALGAATTTTVTIDADPTTAVDAAKPAILALPIARRGRALAISSGIVTTYSVNEPVTVFHDLTLNGRRIGYLSTEVTSASVVRRVVKLTLGGRSYLNGRFIATRARTVTTVLRSTYRDASGNRVVKTARVVITR